jgi:anthraniloyl-CoA monooxygenase
MWTLRAAAQQDYRAVEVPPPYLGGMAQLARNMAREAELKA